MTYSVKAKELAKELLKYPEMVVYVSADPEGNWFSGLGGISVEKGTDIDLGTDEEVIVIWP